MSQELDEETRLDRIQECVENNLDMQLTEEESQGNIKEEEFCQTIQRIWQALPFLLPNVTPGTEDFDIVLRRLMAKYTIVDEGEDAKTVDETQKHLPWLGTITDNDWFFWERYRTYMAKEKQWTKAAVTNLGQTADNILDLLGNPQSAEPFNRRGLIMGDVQAGKTANYTALSAKAADAGYKVIIILTGMLEDLRIQTQERLDSELTGINSAAYANRKTKYTIGVSRLPLQRRNTKDKKIMPFTSTIQDFKSSVLRDNLSNIGDYQSHLTGLFVVKKHKGILDNLADWLDRARNHDVQKQIDLPLLVIDDEADNASVDTNASTAESEDTKPTAINAGIRRILAMFSKTSYVGVTATPFANIFINPDTNDEMLKDDLFPRDFIYALNRTSSAYVGGEKLFLDDAMRAQHIRIIEDYLGMEKIPEGSVRWWFDYKQKKDAVLPDGLPDDLEQALCYFLLANAVRDIRHDRKKHRTMLIHTSHYTNIHNQTAEHVNIWLDEAKSQLRLYASMDGSDKERDEIPLFRKLHQIYNQENFKDLSGVTWKKLCRDYLKEAVEPISVRVRNSTATENINYASHPEGLRVIAVGGNSFSRGLTLEGLCVTYFYRRATMYDSLMQMGRWFGYRSGYEDLCRVWLSEDTVRCFEAVADASRGLKEEIYAMQKNHLAPRDYGLKVRRDPAVVGMIITARNKMKLSYKQRLPVSLSCQYLETPRLRLDDLADNYLLVEQFIGGLDIASIQQAEGGPYFWHDVDKRKIADLLSRFQTPAWHLAFQGSALAQYIRDKMDTRGWDVLIHQVKSGADVHTCTVAAHDGDISINLMERSIELHDDRLDISGSKVRIGSVGMAKYGLTQAQIKAVDEEWRQGHGKSAVPDKAYLRDKDRSPLLVLYFVRVKDQEKYEKVPEIITGLGVGFPDTGETKSYAEYVINQVAYEGLTGMEADDE